MPSSRGLQGRVGDFEIRLIRIFRTVVECGGFTAAESALGIGRSAISLHMGDLERRLGFKLCQRGRGGFALTEEGQQVYQASQTLLAALESFRTELLNLHQTLRGELNIGITDNLVSKPEMVITHALSRLKRQGPEVGINIHMEPSDSISQGVLDGRLHIGVVPEIHSIAGLASRPLYAERSRLYCADTHPLYACPADALDLEALTAHDAVLPTYPLPEPAQQAHALLHGTAKASDREGAAFLILTGEYLGYLPEHFAKPWVEAGRLRPLPLAACQFDTPLITITRRERRPHRVLEAFLAFLDESGAGEYESHAEQISSH